MLLLAEFAFSLGKESLPILSILCKDMIGEGKKRALMTLINENFYLLICLKTDMIISICMMIS